jgi:diguanylate cyclase (GGDEF)-like protein
VSSRIAGCAGGSDVVARLGGDEFVILVSGPAHEADYPAHLIQRLEKSIAAPVEIAGQSFSVTTSTGLARYPADGRSREELLAKADAEMYKAKRARREEMRT